MLIAFISDIHGNMPALEEAVADATAHGASRIICAGDITGYGPFPEDVCRFLRSRRIPTIIGNYDQKVIDMLKQGKSAAEGMKPKKKKILQWTVEHISRETVRYLSGLPDRLDLRLVGGQKLLVVHGSPASMDDAIYPSITRRGLEAKLGDIRPDILVCGHTHIPFVKHIHRVLVVNCSSTGHPIDGDPRPSYALVDVKPGSVPRGLIVRFEYDRDKTIESLAKTSMPKGLQKDFADGNKRRFLQ
ncbi:MAG: metallophosphoesterase family protein [Syntrophales bacterium]